MKAIRDKIMQSDFQGGVRNSNQKKNNIKRGN